MYGTKTVLRKVKLTAIFGKNRLPERNIDFCQSRYDALRRPLLDGVHVNKRVLRSHHLCAARREIGFKQEMSAVIRGETPRVVKS